MLDSIYGMIHYCLEDKQIKLSRRCVLETKQAEILDKCNASPYIGHFARDKTSHKNLQLGFYWPTLFKDSDEWVKNCDRCWRMVNINKRNEMPLQGILVVQIFDVWGMA